MRTCRTVARLVVAGLILATVLSVPFPVGAQERVSSFGRYSGYSKPVYDGWSRNSRYVTMPDGTDLAVFYFIPTLGGEPASQALPTILLYTRYLRAWEENGEVVTFADNASFIRNLVSHGYVFAIANARGSGSSFGARHGEFSAEEAADAYEIIEWLAAQSWCDGNVGMWGRSYSGMTSYHVATQAPPHLKAVFAEMAGPELYGFVYPGGVYRKDFVRQWSSIVEDMDAGRNGVPARVDADTDGSLRDAAVADHADNFRPVVMAAGAKYRNSRRTSPLGVRWSWTMASSIYGADAIKSAEIPVYHLGGWYDIYTTQQTLMFENLRPGPQKMMIGPWTHSGGTGDTVHVAELRRWFDYWLKGIDNGIMKEKPVHYFLMRDNHTVPGSGLPVSQDEIDAEDDRRWKATKTWPPRKAKSKKYFLAGARSGTVASVNDGSLRTKQPRRRKGRDAYTVDFSSTMGSFSRWMDGHGGERPDGTSFFDERTTEDEKALTYTSRPFERPMAISGSPVAHLWVTSSHKDGDFFVYLEEIDSEGAAHYITEGMLRASHRVLGEAPWKNLDLPFHRSFRKDRLKKLPADPVELVFDLMATAIVVDKGHRVRVTITGADTPHHDRYPKGMDAPTISVYRSREHGSFVALPLVKAK